MKRICFFCIPAIVLLVLIHFSTTTVAADPWSVGAKASGDDFDTIAEALADAGVLDTHTLNITGNYDPTAEPFGPLSINKEVTNFSGINFYWVKY